MPIVRDTALELLSSLTDALAGPVTHDAVIRYSNGTEVRQSFRSKSDALIHLLRYRDQVGQLLKNKRTGETWRLVSAKVVPAGEGS